MAPKSSSSAGPSLCRVLLGLALAGGLLSTRAAAQPVFVSDDGANAILQVGAGGSVSTYGTGVGVPEGLTFDSSGNLYVANATTNSIMTIAPGGGVATTLVTGVSASGLAADSNGNVFATDNGSNVFKVTPGINGTTAATFATGFSDVLGLAFDSSGNLFVADGGTNTLYKIAPDGTVLPFATSANGLSGYLDGVAVGFGGNIYVSDITGGNVFQVTPGGAVSIFATGLTHARGLSFDPTTNLLFVTTGYSSFNGAGLSEITSTGVVSFLAGNLTDANYTAIMPAVMPVPEPGTWALLLLGATQLACWTKRSRRVHRQGD